MRQKCSFILKASLALVLALLMLFGTMATSLAAAVDELAETGSPTTYYITGNVPDADWGTWKPMTNSTYGLFSYCQLNTTSNNSEFKISTAQNYDNVIADRRIAEFWGSNGVRLNSGNPNFWKSSQSGNWGVYSGAEKSKYVLLAQPNTMLNNDNYPKLIAYVDSMPATDDTPHYYIYGDFDDDGTWEDHELTLTSGTNYSTTITLDADVTRNFKIKIKYGDFTKYYAMNGTVTESTNSWKLYNDNSTNAAITSRAAGTYTFTFDSSSMTYNEFPIGVTYPTLHTITVRQYKGTTGETVKAGTVKIGDTSVTTSGGTASVLDNTATATKITAPTGYTVSSVSGAGWARNSGDTGTTEWNGTISASSNQTLTVRYAEDTKGVEVDVNTNGTRGTTGGNITIGGTPGDASGANTVNVGIDTSATIVEASVASGYTFTGWTISGTNYSHLKYSINGSSWNNVTSNGMSIAATNTTLYIKTDGNSGVSTSTAVVTANFNSVHYISAFDSYINDNGTIRFVTAPPKSIEITRGSDKVTYTYSGTAAKGNPNTGSGSGSSGGTANPNGILDVTPTSEGATSTYGQGNYITVYAGDVVKLSYSAMSSSEIIKGVFYNNSVEYNPAKPSVNEFKDHTYAAGTVLYANSTLLPSVTGEIAESAVDHNAHSVTFTVTKDYKNIDVEIGSKYRVFFNDNNNTVITSKNTDNYYYNGEAISETSGTNPKQLTVAAKKSDTQQNVIDGTKVKFYEANEDGTKKNDTELTGLSITQSTSTGTDSADGDALVISGTMPSYNVYVDLGVKTNYSMYLGSKMISDEIGNTDAFADVAAVKIRYNNSDLLTASETATTVEGPQTVEMGKPITLSIDWKTDKSSNYMFSGWFKGTDSGPDLDNGFISDKESFSYTPKSSLYIWAVGTRDLYINGSAAITGSNHGNWNIYQGEGEESATAHNFKMSFDPKKGTNGMYYWTITDTMYAAAGSDGFTDGAGIKKIGDYYYWNDKNNMGNSYFQFFDTATGDDNNVIWDLPETAGFINDSDERTKKIQYGRIRQDNESGTDHWKAKFSMGYIKFNEADFAGYSSPLTIYYDPTVKGKFTVEPTPTFANIYVSNGFDVGSTSKATDTTVEPVYNGNVVTSGNANYFSVGVQGGGWSPNSEGHVNHYKPQKKNATVRISKTAGGNDKIAAFMIYNTVTGDVRAEKDLENDGRKYYFDLTLDGTMNLYIVPIVEEEGADVTINFDATQLNRAQWGDIVTAYAWYQNKGGNALGAYPGQPMIVSDDGSTWTTKFKSVKGDNELEGITFSNYVDSGNGHGHSWLGENGIMGTVTDHTSGEAEGGIVNVYNHVYSGNKGEFSRTNFKAQTYDYREPIALYENRDKALNNFTINFAMKDGNSSLISWKHSEFEPENIISGQWGSSLRWEYLTNAKGDKYVDMNGVTMDSKPTASFFVAAKGQVIYKNSKLETVFHGGTNGNDYQDVSSQNIMYNPTDVSNVSFNYAVQWYVYDAAGNYITTVLSAGLADKEDSFSYIGKRLNDMGYAVDGKSVAMCYDKPRYMYNDKSNVGVGINSEVGAFNAYRFTGQWIAAGEFDKVKVNVGVAMMTESGEILSETPNTESYGSATAVYDIQKGQYGSYTSTDNKQSYVEVLTADAPNSPVKLEADNTSNNFIGWYYYDANTGVFTPAQYKSNVDFYPNFTNKDVTFYAVYKASATYRYKYTGRRGQVTYTTSAGDLSADEMGNSNKINPEQADRKWGQGGKNDISNLVPKGVSVFKKTIDFSKANDGGSITYDNTTNAYNLDISNFYNTAQTFTLTYNYRDANGGLVTKTKEAVYNGGAVDITSLNGGAVTGLWSSHRFIGWYEYNSVGDTVGDLLSPQANYGMQLTKDQSIIAVYEGDIYNKSLPEDSWNVFVDENIITREMTTETSGTYYNDTIVRVRNGSDVKAELGENDRIGVLVVSDNKTGVDTQSDSISSKLNTLVTAVAPGKSAKTTSGLTITNIQTAKRTGFNRTDLAVTASYANNYGANYTVYAYAYINGQYYFSAPSAVGTYN